MGSYKRLQHINKILADSYPDLTISNTSTLVMNYIESRDLKDVEFSNITYESKFKNQIKIF